MVYVIGAQLSHLPATAYEIVVTNKAAPSLSLSFCLSLSVFVSLKQDYLVVTSTLCLRMFFIFAHIHYSHTLAP